MSEGGRLVLDRANPPHCGQLVIQATSAWCRTRRKPPTPGDASAETQMAAWPGLAAISSGLPRRGRDAVLAKSRYSHSSWGRSRTEPAITYTAYRLA